MKKLFFCLLVCGLAANASAQQNGTLVYQTTAGAGRERYVFGYDTRLQPIFRGPSPNVDDFAGLPKLEGTRYSAELWYSLNPSSTEGSLLPVAGSLVDFRTGATAGLIRGKPELEIPLTRGGDVVALQLRAWDNEGGVYGSYREARTRGASQVFTFQLAGTDGSGGTYLGDGALANKMHHFQVFPVPEPSILGLGGLLAAGLAFRRRRSARSTSAQ